jgi:uncharacterized protein YciI/ketosteroid isomerase-like protein
VNRTESPAERPAEDLDHGAAAASGTTDAGRLLFALVFRPGPAWVRGAPVGAQPLAPHLAHMKRLWQAGRLVLAGPFLDDRGGLAVIEAGSLEEAMRVLAADPAVASGVMTAEVHPWRTVFDRARAAAAGTGARGTAEDRGPARRNVDAIRALYAAIEARDADAVWRVHADDVVVHEAPSLPYGGTYFGPDGVRRHAFGYVAAWNPVQRDEDRRLDPELVADGDRVAVLWHQRAHDHATGEAMDMPMVTIHTMVGGRVVESRMFHFDTVVLRDLLARGRGAPTAGDPAVTEAEPHGA